MKVYLSLFLMLFCTIGLSAQDLSRLSGKVLDKEGQAVEYAAVVISGGALKSPKGTTSGSDGGFSIEVPAGQYALEVSLVGYDKYTLTVNLDKNIILEDIRLQDDVRMLDGARVSANRIEYNNSGYEYKISNIAALQKLDLSDVLNTAPGISVTSRNVLLYGREISNVYVDRRRVKMTAGELVDYLNAFKGDNIEKIEVITDPDISALHPGTAIRITTRKQKGGIASVSTRVNGSDSRFVLHPTLNVTYRRGKMMLYSSGSYMTMTSIDEQAVISDWKESARHESEITKTRLRLPLSAGATVGAGYDLGKNDYLSAEASYREIRRHQDREIVTESTGESGGNTSDTQTSQYNSVYSTPTASVMYEHTFKDASALTLSTDFVGSYRTTDISGDIAGGCTANDVSTFAAYAGYSKRFGRSHSMNAGMRYTYIDNDASNDSWSFAYDESELNPFASYSYMGSKIGISAGLQGHFADIGGKSFSDVTPNVSLNYYINRSQGHRLRASYSLDVTRPSMSQLNPNAVFSDVDIIIAVGNPDLKSFSSHNYGLDLTLFNDYNLRTSYSTMNDGTAAYMYSDEDGNIYRTYVNGAMGRDAGVSFYTNMTLFGRLSMRVNVGYKYSESIVSGNSSKYNSLNYSVNASMPLPKDFSIDMLISGNTGSMAAHNAVKKSVPFADLSVEKRIKNWRIGLQMQNLLDNGKNKTTIDMGDYTKTVSSRTSRRIIQLTLSYNFRWGEAGMSRIVETMKNTLTNRIGQ